MRVCEYPGCNNKHSAKGYCSKHYVRLRNHGDPSVNLIFKNYLTCNNCKKQVPKKLVIWCGANTFCTENCRQRYSRYHKKKRARQQACKLIYEHSKNMKNDPEALTDEFMQTIVGVTCKKLADKKNNKVIS